LRPCETHGIVGTFNTDDSSERHCKYAIQATR
jgi:hypothetical protein